MKAFEMEANHKHTEFAITNYLWDLMDNIWRERRKKEATRRGG